MNLSKVLNSIYTPLETSSAEEIKHACELIARVQRMEAPERDTLRCAFLQGPLFDGDVPSKWARDILVKDGFMARVVVRGEDGYNACTYKGRTAYQIMEEIIKRILPPSRLSSDGRALAS